MILCVGQSLLQQRVAHVEVGVGDRQREKRSGAHGSAGQLGQQGIEQFDGAFTVAGSFVEFGGADQAEAARFVGVSGGEPGGFLEQLRRDVGGAPAFGHGRALFDRRRDLAIRRFGAEGEVTRALLGVVDDLGQPPMQRAAL